MLLPGGCRVFHWSKTRLWWNESPKYVPKYCILHTKSGSQRGKDKEGCPSIDPVTSGPEEDRHGGSCNLSFLYRWPAVFIVPQELLDSEPRYSALLPIVDDFESEFFEGPEFTEGPSREEMNIEDDAGVIGFDESMPADDEEEEDEEMGDVEAED